MTAGAKTNGHDALREGISRVLKHQDAGRFEEAAMLLEELIVDHGEVPILQHYKGINKMQTGNRDAGLALIESAIEGAPDDPVISCDYGAQLANMGRLDDALIQFETAVELAPNYAIARSNLGAAQVLRKEFQPAITNLKRAVELDGRMLDAHTNLGTAYMETNQFELAVDVLFKALSINPLDGAIHTRLSAALYRRERHDTAEYHARRAIELLPNATEPYLHLGNALASAGRVDEAAEAFLFAARRPPVGLAALSRLIHLRKTEEESQEFTMLENFLAREERLEAQGRSTLFFAAGKAFDDLGRFDRAFDYFKRANDLSKELHPFGIESFVQRNTRLREFTTPALVARCSGAGLDDVAPIFICGMPRSGTTLTEQMLSRHPDVQAGGEMSAAMVALQKNKRLAQALGTELDDDEIVADDFKRLAEDYISAVRAEGIRSPHFTDKMPANHRHIGLLSLALPRARFLVMRRHPLDCLLSNYFQHFGQNQPFSSDFEWMATVFSHFAQDAAKWTGMFPDQAREIHYENVVNATEDEIRKILEFIGLDWHDDVLDHQTSSHFVNTASISQVREPIYTRAMARWEKYEDHIGDLIALLDQQVPGALPYQATSS